MLPALNAALKLSAEIFAGSSDATVVQSLTNSPCSIIGDAPLPAGKRTSVQTYTTLRAYLMVIFHQQSDPEQGETE